MIFVISVPERIVSNGSDTDPIDLLFEKKQTLYAPVESLNIADGVKVYRLKGEIVSGYWLSTSNLRLIHKADDDKLMLEYDCTYEVDNGTMTCDVREAGQRIEVSVGVVKDFPMP